MIIKQIFNFYRNKAEMKNRIFRRSIYCIKEIKKGDKFSKNNIASFRPETGLSTSFYPLLLGKKSPINIKKNRVLSKNIMKYIN